MAWESLLNIIASLLWEALRKLYLLICVDRVLKAFQCADNLLGWPPQGCAVLTAVWSHASCAMRPGNKFPVFFPFPPLLRLGHGWPAMALRGQDGGSGGLVEPLYFLFGGGGLVLSLRDAAWVLRVVGADWNGS